MGQPRREHGASEDTDALGQPLHLMVLRQEGPFEVPISGQPRPGQRVLCHELLPACVVTLVRDVPLAHLPLQLSKVQPCLVLLGPGEQGLACRAGSTEAELRPHVILPEADRPGINEGEAIPSATCPANRYSAPPPSTAQPVGGSATLGATENAPAAFTSYRANKPSGSTPSSNPANETSLPILSQAPPPASPVTRGG